MRHRLASLFALLVLTSFAPQSHAADEVLPTNIFKNLKAGKTQTVIVYGTSLTAGGAWANAVKEWFDKEYPQKVKFVNSGGPGQNSNWGLANLKTKVLDLKPDLVFVEFSFNDAHKKFKMDVPKGAENLDAIVRGIRAQNSETDIVLQIMNAPWDAKDENGGLSSRPQLQAFNDNYRDYARKEKLPLLDHYPAWQNLKETKTARYKAYTPDGVHPTREGSLAITWPAIKAMLEKAQAAAK